MAAPTCSAASLGVEEPQAGTATESIDQWLLLEVTNAWAPKPLESSPLSSTVRARLARWLEVPGRRLQLVRRPGRAKARSVFMLVSASESWMSRVELDRYEDLQDIELDALPRQAATPLCLVCVHGRRDRCCAEHGSAFFRALRGEAVEAWQTSHLGGHRFAACALWLPDGLMYGRLRPEHAKAFVEARLAGRIGDLGLFRGRCAYDRATQAAEIFIRAQNLEQGANALDWLGTSSDGDRCWTARFRRRGAPDEHVRVRLEEARGLRPTSCGGAAEPVTRWVQV